MNIDFSRVITRDDHDAGMLQAARRMARARLILAIDAAAERVTGRVPLTEMLSWSVKEHAARAWASGLADGAAARLIAGEAEMTGENPDTLASRILRNAEVYRCAVAMLTGLRRGAETAIASARTPEEVTLAADEAAARLDAALS